MKNYIKKNKNIKKRKRENAKIVFSNLHEHKNIFFSNTENIKKYVSQHKNY